MPIGDYLPVPKPVHGRRKKTARQRGAVSKDVHAAARERSGGRCAHCGKGPHEAWTLEAAHTRRRWTIGQEGTGPEDIVILCGPSTDSSTCHWWADNTAEGRKWLSELREALLKAKGDTHEGN